MFGLIKKKKPVGVAATVSDLLGYDYHLLMITIANRAARVNFEHGGYVFSVKLRSVGRSHPFEYRVLSVGYRGILLSGTGYSVYWIPRAEEV